jgi:hypothetical protein
LYTWGNGSDWRLGHGSESNEKFPKKVSTLSDFIVHDIQLGVNHCIAFAGTLLLQDFILLKHDNVVNLILCDFLFFSLSDNGKSDRNKFVMKILAHEKQYVRNMGVICRVHNTITSLISNQTYPFFQFRF